MKKMNALYNADYFDIVALLLLFSHIYPITCTSTFYVGFFIHNPYN